MHSEYEFPSVCSFFSSIMSIASVTHKYAFGIKADCKDNVHWLDENSILYPSGNNVIIYNSETKTQKFIQASEKSGGITSLTVSANR